MTEEKSEQLLDQAKLQDAKHQQAKKQDAAQTADQAEKASLVGERNSEKSIDQEGLQEPQPDSAADQAGTQELQPDSATDQLDSLDLSGGEPAPAGESYLASIWRRFKRHKLGMVSLGLFLLLVVLAILAPVISPYDPNAIVGGFGQPPSSEFLLGTDLSGRDVLSRLLHASRISLLAGVLVTLLSTTVGVSLGLISGFFGSWVDSIIMRFTDMVMSFPYMLLVLMFAAIFEPGLWSIILILGFVNWPGVARLVRGNVLSLRETPFIKRTQVQGLPGRIILFGEILPNTIAPILVHATSVMAFAILDEAALSFLAMGVQPPTASLGNMLGDAKSLTILTDKPWLWLPSGLVIVILVMAINFIGDALRDAVDPTTSRS